LFPEDRYYGTHHISLAEWADLILIAPASGNAIGKIASGIADDLLTTVVMAAQSPVMIAPTMNTEMYNNPVVQENITKLKKLNYKFIEPGVGELACKTYGVGRFAEPYDILTAVESFFRSGNDLEGLKILVTAGPTVEQIDAVRFISNPSSGKMGYALAQKASERGALVTLISGPVSLEAPAGVNRIMIRSGEQMYNAAVEEFEECDLLFMAAAVGDYKPSQTANHKIKKSTEPLSLELIPQIDILQKLAETKKNQITVGFALETDDEIENARDKLENKKLDLIVLNNPNEKGAGFAVDTNRVTVIDRDGKIEKIDLMPKIDLADKLIDHAKKYLKRDN
jgi:phosphopantothenoylcysteine decarboxylase/phosphopantothenate--cysteine ligase